MLYRVWTLGTRPQDGLLVEASSGHAARRQTASRLGLDITNTMARLEPLDLDKRYDQCADLIHAAEGQHAAIGAEVARWIDKRLRLAAIAEGRKSKELGESEPLCPGCYTLILIEALLELARSQNQSVAERCAFMAREFARLADAAQRGEPVQAREGDSI